MGSYAIQPKQSLFDVAIEVYGSTQGIVWILQDNPSIPGPTGPVQVGQAINIRAAKIDARTAAALVDFAPFQTITSDEVPVGIGYWSLEDYEVK